jgi:hypothetical protein
MTHYPDEACRALVAAALPVPFPAAQAGLGNVGSREQAPGIGLAVRAVTAITEGWAHIIYLGVMDHGSSQVSTGWPPRQRLNAERTQPC